MSQRAEIFASLRQANMRLRQYGAQNTGKLSRETRAEVFWSGSQQVYITRESLGGSSYQLTFYRTCPCS